MEWVLAVVAIILLAWISTALWRIYLAARIIAYNLMVIALVQRAEARKAGIPLNDREPMYLVHR